MKNKFDLDELEEFLSDSAEQHRMYPSDKVWRNINKEMHGNSRWPALTFGAVLTGAIITAGLILVHPDKNLFTVNLPATSSQSLNSIATSANGGQTPVKTLLPGVQNKESFTNRLLHEDGSLAEAGVSTVTGNPTLKTIPGSPGNDETAFNSSSPEPGVLTSTNTESVTNATTEKLASVLPETPTIINFSRSFEARTGFSEQEENILKVSTLPENLSDSKNAQFIAIRPSRAKRLSAFFYVTPSISYRYLGESKNIDLHMQGGPIAPNLTHGVNNFVRQKPIAGVELGGGLMFQLSPSVRVKTGLQFSVRGYSIDAFASKRQPSMLILDRGLYTDSVVAMSNISNVDGYQSIQITNRYFEVSAPVTIDLKLADIKKIQLYVAAGLQPTYQFNNGMYMVSADYKNYIQRPELARHFNVNSSLEAFITYKAGGLTWQAGPQLRYQLLSGALKEYPIHEHLFDYGLKIGVVKTLR